MKAPSKDTWIAAAWILAFMLLLAFMQNKDVMANQSSYVKGLEKIVTACTNKGDNPITIDGEIYMCGATRTGIKVKP